MVFAHSKTKALAAALAVVDLLIIDLQKKKSRSKSARHSKKKTAWTGAARTQCLRLVTFSKCWLVFSWTFFNDSSLDSSCRQTTKRENIGHITIDTRNIAREANLGLGSLDGVLLCLLVFFQPHKILLCGRPEPADGQKASIRTSSVAEESRSTRRCTSNAHNVVDLLLRLCLGLLNLALHRLLDHIQLVFQGRWRVARVT